MKKVKAFMLALLMMVSILPSNFVLTAEAKDTRSILSFLSEVVEKYDTDDYFSTISVTIGDPNLIIDGEAIPIDASGSTAYIDNGRTMMPVRGIAEAMGAEVSYDSSSKTVIVENNDTTIEMRIGKNEMEVNGHTISLLTAPRIKESRTMLPIRDVAEALDCEVEWDENRKTAVFSRAYQTKRVIVNSEKAITKGSVAHFSAEGKTIIQFDNIDAAKECVEANIKKGFIAEPDYIRKADSMSWGINDIGSNNYYNQVSYVGGSAVVAVIDTGIDYDHEFFKGRIVDGYDLYFSDNYCEDVMGHGSHVASTILDVAGANKNIKIMPIKVFGDKGGAPSEMVAGAIKYAADNGADVINLSLGGQHKSYSEQEAIAYANSKNVVVVAAAGNESLNLEVTPYAPGGLEGVITVSAMQRNKTLANFSNYGNGVVEFTAPGVDIKGVRAGGGYCNLNGTSMASPHVAGAYALVKAAHPNTSTEEITEALSENALSVGSSKYFGAGLICLNGLEEHLSRNFSSDLRAEDITQTDATIRGVLWYKGIIPSEAGLMIGNEDVYSTRFRDDIGGEMNFTCNLNRNANYKLKPGTTYEAKIFIIQGGIRYVTSSIRFTTEAAPIQNPDPQPEPEPTPEPEKSELRILPSAYPQGSINEGSKFTLSGRIKSNYHITDVRSYILDSNKKVVQEASGWTTTATYVIENSSLDTGLKFEKLQPGTYYIKYSAADETGNKVSWISDAFSVKKKEVAVEPTVTAVVLIPDSFENLSIRTGPSTDYPVIGSMNHTVKCTVYTNKTKNGWYFVNYNGKEGYAAGNYIYLPSETRTGTISIPSSWENLSIRSGPSTDYKVLGSMNHGVKCTVFPDKAKNGWAFVEYNGIYGYASGNYIK